MKFQRDKVGLDLFKRLVVSMYQAFILKLLGKKADLEWQLILIADCFRIIGLCRLAHWFALKVQTSTFNPKHQFWSAHTLATSLHYAGDIAAAEEAFIQSQVYACEFSLSFSLQHLGKLNTEIGSYDLAEKQFNHALLIRQKLKKNDLVKSTHRAIQGLEKRRARHGATD